MRAWSARLHHRVTAAAQGRRTARRPKSPNPFRFDSSPEVIRLMALLYVRCLLSLRNVEDLLHERGVDVCDETLRLWVERFRPMFARLDR